MVCSPLQNVQPKPLILMKRIRQLFLQALLFSISPYFLFAQSVGGKVSGAKDGQPLPGVSIILKGTNQGTTSDMDGNFKINATQGATLVFSYVGYLSKEINVSSASVIHVTLDEVAKNLTEVVVTALGIKKDAKKLGYATSTITSDASPTS